MSEKLTSKPESRIVAHRGIRDKNTIVDGQIRGYTPQSIEALSLPGSGYSGAIEVDSSVAPNGDVQTVHVKNEWPERFEAGESYDEVQTDFENDMVGSRLADTLWQSWRNGGHVVDEIKGSSPEAARESAKRSFEIAEATIDKLSQGYDAHGVLEKEDAPVEYMSFSPEALDQLKSQRETTDTEQLRNTPLYLLGTSKLDNVHDMSMSETILGHMESAGIQSDDNDWGTTMLEFAAAKGYDGIAPHWSVVDKDLVDAANEKGLGVSAWTVPKDKIDEFKAMGVHNIMAEEATPYEKEKLSTNARVQRKLAKRALK